MVCETDLYRSYDSIRAEARKESLNRVAIFVSGGDCDSVCALKILTNLLQIDGLQYSVTPVCCYEEIQQEFDRALDDSREELVAILLNCGGTEDLQALLNIRDRTEVHLFVFDSHRPLHHRNLESSNTQVVTVYVAGGDLDDLYGDVAKLADEIAMDSDESSEEELSDDEDDDPEQHRDKRRRRDERNDKKRQKAEYYSRGAFYGLPCAYVLYNVADRLQRDTKELLWFAIVAVHDQRVHFRMSKERYNILHAELESKVNKNLEMPSEVTLDTGVTVKAPVNHRIVCEDECQFTLLGHWSLYDAMMNSTYSAVRLKTWLESGQGQLDLLLARMGIPIAESKQKFIYMTPESKRRLRRGFEAGGVGWNKLEGVYYPSFRKQHCYSRDVSAADCASAVTAILEVTEWEGKSWKFNFWEASRALSNWDALTKAIDLAIKVQCAVARQGSLALQKKGEVRPGAKFNIYHLNDPSDQVLLAHPLALTKLAQFIMVGRQMMGKSLKPLLATARLPGGHKYLVMGVNPTPKLGQTSGNYFGVLFQKIADDVFIEIRHNDFETCWVEVEAENWAQFQAGLESSATSLD